MRAASSQPKVSHLGRYEILGRIATGGMATVYLARLGGASGFNREFALKVIHPHLADDPDFRSRLFQEARLASRVRHPNAVRTIDAGEAQGYRYLVLELIDGVNLRQLLLHRSRPLSPRQAAAVVAQVGRGLSALHNAKDEHGQPLAMVHRDLSPHNVMIDREGRAILIDFGLAKAADLRLTEVGVMCGKLPYMSPEQARMESVDARSDLFSLGTVLYELCTGELPFGDDHSTTTLEALVRCDPAAIVRGLRGHEVPAWMIEIVLMCLQHDPAARFESAAELVEVLCEKLQAEGFDEARIRDSLANLVAEAIPVLGAMEGTDRTAVLVPRIEAAPRGRWSGVRWAVAGAAVTVLFGAGVYLVQGWRSDALPEAPSLAPGMLANDQAHKPRVPAAIVPARPLRVEAPRVEEPAPADTDASPEPAIDTDVDEVDDVADTDDPADDVADPPRRRRRWRSRAAVLKPNPYAQ